MADWKMAPDDAIRRVLTGLRAEHWPIPPAEVEPLLERLGWRAVSRQEAGVLGEAGLGIGPAEASVDFSGFGETDVSLLQAELTGRVLGNSPAKAAFLQDAFARVVALATEELGPPTERRHTTYPEVRWRNDEATLAVVRGGPSVLVRVQPNARQDSSDAADARVAEAQA